MKFIYNREKILTFFIFLKFNLQISNSLCNERSNASKKLPVNILWFEERSRKKALLHRGINQMRFPRNPAWVKTMYSLQGKWEERLSENTSDLRSRISQTSQVPTRLRHVHGSLPNSRCHRKIRATLSLTGEAVREDAISASPTVARTRSRKCSDNFAKSTTRTIFGSGPRQFLISWGETSRGNLFSNESVLSLLPLYSLYFAILYGGGL